MQHLSQFLRFCVVGGIGFLVDAGGLELLVMCGLPPAIARLGSIAIALQVTYLLHGAFTFRSHGGYSFARWVSFIGFNLLGAAVNYAVFMGVLSLALFGEDILNRQAALLAGTAVALLCNYWMNHRFVFSARDPK